MSILLCYDGSPSARKAIQTMSHTLQSADVTLLNVWTRPVEFLSDSFGDAGVEVETTLHDLEAQAEQRAEQIVEEGRRLAAEAGITVTTRIARSEGSDWETIVNTAEQIGAEMIVVGAHPQGVPGPSLESVSERVIEHARRPVLVVPS